MEAEKSTKESILWVMANVIAHMFYFISLFILGIILALAITYIGRLINPDMAITTVQLIAIATFSIICMIDMGLIFSNKISPAILLFFILLISVLGICIIIAIAINRATKSEFVDTLKSILIPYRSNSEENKINVLANDIYNHRYRGSF
jgi:hypothetical protein